MCAEESVCVLRRVCVWWGECVCGGESVCVVGRVCVVWSSSDGSFGSSLWHFFGFSQCMLHVLATRNVWGYLVGMISDQ